MYLDPPSSHKNVDRVRPPLTKPSGSEHVNLVANVHAKPHRKDLRSIFGSEPGQYIVLPAKSDSEVIFCLQSYQGLIIDRSLVY